jgi:hypothetical protein
MVLIGGLEEWVAIQWKKSMCMRKRDDQKFVIGCRTLDNNQHPIWLLPESRI